jgi:hypothetical protein
LTAGYGASRPKRPIPIREKIPDTVESAMPKHSAMSGPVIRNRRKRRDRLQAPLRRAVVHRLARRTAIQQPEL